MRPRRALLTASGLVAVAAGAHQAAGGLGAVAGAPRGLAEGPGWVRDVDSELRFYGTWYAASGALALAHARRDEEPSDAWGVVWVAAAAARAAGAARVGTPSGLFRALTVAELVLGGALLAARRGRLSP